MKNKITEEKVNMAHMLYNSGVKTGIITKAAGISSASIHRLIESDWDLKSARSKAAESFRKSKGIVKVEKKDTPAKEVSNKDITPLLDKLTTLTETMNRTNTVMTQLLVELIGNKKEEEIVRQIKQDELCEDIDGLKPENID